MSVLNEAGAINFIATAKPDEARRFYEDVLGLRFVDDSPFALVFDAHGTMLRIQKVRRVADTGYTVLGWQVDDIHAALKELTQAGVTFERYEGMPQDEQGVLATPDGSAVAWFKDPDGNTLSIAQFPRPSDSQDGREPREVKALEAPLDEALRLRQKPG